MREDIEGALGRALMAVSELGRVVLAEPGATRGREASGEMPPGSVDRARVSVSNLRHLLEKIGDDETRRDDYDRALREAEALVDVLHDFVVDVDAGRVPAPEPPAEPPAEELRELLNRLAELERYTFRVEYSPNCAKPYRIRLVGSGAGEIDGLPVDRSLDLIAHGDTFVEAASKAVEYRREFQNKN